MRQLNHAFSHSFRGHVSGFLILLSCLFCAALHAESYTFSTFAGPDNANGSDDGTGAKARFNLPYGVAVDGSGNVYVAEEFNDTIRKITPGGVVSTFAGTAGMRGFANGTGAAARFSIPSGVAVDSSGNVYVAGYDDDTIRKITPGGVVSTLAGAAGVIGTADGTGSAARFSSPKGVAVDGSGNVYVADNGNNTIRKITPGGMVSTLAGTAGSFGSVNGMGSAARFAEPTGVAVDSSGNVYVADTANDTIRKIAPDGTVSTLAGSAGTTGSADGQGTLAQFNGPTGVALDSSGNVYVADITNNTIRKITPGGMVSTLAGTAGVIGTADGTGAAAQFYFPSGVALDSSGNVYVADDFNQTIRKITPGGVVSTLAGTPGPFGSTDGAAAAAQFNSPIGVALDASKNVYVTDSSNNTIRKITPGGVVSTLAGTAGASGHADGTGAAARFFSPTGVAVDGSGNVYVADAGNSTIRKITPGGVVSTLAGTPGMFGSADGTGAAARFFDSEGLAVDSSGNIYVADSGSTIRKITPGGVVSTLAGMAGAFDSTDGTGAAARFNEPTGVAVDGSGNIYVADSDNQTIRKITPGGVVSTLAGTAGMAGSANGTGAAARFLGPNSVAVDGSGNVYVTESTSNTIRKITPGGVVSTLGGVSQVRGSADGTGAAAQFYSPNGIAVDSSDNLYIADSNNNSIRIGKPTTVADVATIDSATVTVGVMRQLDTSPQTATSWSWSLIRRPNGSNAQLSSTTIRNPTFTPDVDDLYVFRLAASNSNGTTESTVSLGGVPASNPVPVLTGFQPAAANAGGAAYVLTLNGSQFIAGSVVKWSGQADLTPATQTSSQLTVLVPASYIAKKGTASVSVFNPAPGGGTSATQSIPISTPATTITSGPTATPNPALVQTSVTFSIAAANSNHASLTYTWEFGDGSQASGASPNHTFALAGVYSVVVTIDDGTAPVTGSVDVTVTAAVIGEGPDTDGDGFSDSFESFAGSDPNSATSTPISQAVTAGNVGDLVVSKAAIKLNFAKSTGNDSISFSGTLSVPQAFNPTGAVVLIDAGGVLKMLTLGSKGSVKAGNDSFKMTLKLKKGMVQANPAAKFSATFSKGSFAETLGEISQLSDDTLKNVVRPVAFSVVFNGTALKKGQVMHYTATAGKSGSAK